MAGASVDCGGGVVDLPAAQLLPDGRIAKHFDLAPGTTERGKLIGDHRAIPVLVLDGGAVVAARGD
jgi:hypothetical protein